MNKFRSLLLHSSLPEIFIIEKNALRYQQHFLFTSQPVGEDFTFFPKTRPKGVNRCLAVSITRQFPSRAIHNHAHSNYPQERGTLCSHNEQSFLATNDFGESCVCSNSGPLSSTSAAKSTSFFETKEECTPFISTLWLHY